MQIKVGSEILMPVRELPRDEVQALADRFADLFNRPASPMTMQRLHDEIVRTMGDAMLKEPMSLVLRDRVVDVIFGRVPCPECKAADVETTTKGALEGLVKNTATCRGCGHRFEVWT